MSRKYPHRVTCPFCGVETQMANLSNGQGRIRSHDARAIAAGSVEPCPEIVDASTAMRLERAGVAAAIRARKEQEQARRDFDDRKALLPATAGQDALWQVFGPNPNELEQREIAGLRRTAVDLGHRIWVIEVDDGWGWECSCGRQSTQVQRAERQGRAQSRAVSDADTHLRWAIGA